MKFKIGEFAKIAQVSVRLLRHYDDIDLFKPTDTNPESGYRYYGIEQLTRLNSILALRDLGFSLEQIGIMLHDGIGVDEMQSLLKLQQTQLEQKISEEQARLDRIKSRIHFLEEQGTRMTHDIVVKSIPKMHCLALTETCPNVQAMIRTYHSVYHTAQHANIQIEGRGIALFYKLGFKRFSQSSEPMHWSLGFIVDKPTEMELPLIDDTSRKMKFIELPAVEMATVMHMGPIEEMRRAYHAIHRWGRENGYRFLRPHREYYVRLMNDGKGDVIEIQGLIEKIQ